jgi:hypothetical protein
MTAFAIVLAIYFFYPSIDSQIQKYLESLPEEVQESISIGSLEEPAIATGSSKGVALLEFIKRSGIYFTQPLIHSFYTA